MPMPTDRIEVLLDGKVHDDWTHYRIVSDLKTPADAFEMSISPRDLNIPPNVVAGAGVEVRMGGYTILTGRIDDVQHQVSKGDHSLSLTGRDGAATLVDCSAPIFTATQSTLEEIVAKVVRPLGITKIRIDAKTQIFREKVSVDPGASAWDMLQNAAEANGLWPWFEPDGTLVIGGPDYSAASVATLILLRSGKGNNVIQLDESSSIHNRFSDVTVLGQSTGTLAAVGKHAIKATAKDTGVRWYRPRIIVDYEADSIATAQARARKAIADGRLESYTLTAKVKGHRISGSGAPWMPGQRIQVVSELHGIDRVFFLIARTLEGGRDVGQTTELTLKEDGAWILDAHPHKLKHRKKGESTLLPDGEILDLS